jgi:hypothetical protein
MRDPDASLLNSFERDSISLRSNKNPEKCARLCRENFCNFIDFFPVFKLMLIVLLNCN